MAARKVPRPFNYSWGSGQIIEEACFEGEHSEPSVQLLRYDGGDHDGDESVRFCFYNLRGAFQRHPLMLGADDIPKLREALKETPRLRALLRDLLHD